MPNVTIHITDEQLSTLIEALTGASSDEAAIDAIIPRDTEEEFEPSDPTSNVDSHGVSWHPEHHSSVKKLTNKGRWKRVRGGDKKACDVYEAGHGVEQIQTTVFPTTLQEEVDDVLPPVVEVIEDKILEPMLPTPTMLPMPSAAPIAEPITYEALLLAFKEASDRVGGDIVLDKVGAIYAEVGVQHPNELTTDETLRAGVYERLVAL